MTTKKKRKKKEKKDNENNDYKLFAMIWNYNHGKKLRLRILGLVSHVCDYYHENGNLALVIGVVFVLKLLVSF